MTGLLDKIKDKVSSNSSNASTRTGGPDPSLTEISSNDGPSSTRATVSQVAGEQHDNYNAGETFGGASTATDSLESATGGADFSSSGDDYGAGEATDSGVYNPDAGMRKARKDPFADTDFGRIASGEGMAANGGRGVGTPVDINNPIVSGKGARASGKSNAGMTTIREKEL